MPVNPEAAIAEAKASGPGTAMLVVGILTLPMSVLAMLAGLVNVAEQASYAYSDEELIGTLIGGTVGIGFYVLNFIMGIVVAAAGWKMRNLESHTLCMVGAVALIIPCCGQVWCCWPLGLAFGIWAMVTLMNDDVKAAFQ